MVGNLCFFPQPIRIEFISETLLVPPVGRIAVVVVVVPVVVVIVVVLAVVALLVVVLALLASLVGSRKGSVGVPFGGPAQPMGGFWFFRHR